MKKFITFFMLIIALAFGINSSYAAQLNYVTVKKGDTMWLIAQRYNVSFAQVLEVNKKHHINPDLIHVGDKVYLPSKNVGTSTNQNSNADNIQQGNNASSGSATSQQAQEVLQLVNAERNKMGLKSLTLSINLTSIANTKAKDMAVNNYFSHTSPTYGTPFEMLQHFGVSYRSAGENIAAGQRSATEVMNAWMNSSGHRANILNSSYTELGVGYYAGGSYGTEWVQLFVGK